MCCIWSVVSHRSRRGCVEMESGSLESGVLTLGKLEWHGE